MTKKVVMKFHNLPKAFSFLMLLVLPAGSCSKQAPLTAGTGKAAEAVPVTVARATQETVPVNVEAIGWVEAYAKVTIKPLVSGQITEIHFKEGDELTQDQQLFTIDPRPYQAALELAQANLERDRAVADDAVLEARRVARLFENNQAADRELQQSQADAEAKSAQLRADQAEVEQAQLELEYCSIRSPISGLAGRYLVNQGNIVKTDETELVSINQIKPIYVAFSVPEQYLDQIQSAMAQPPLKVTAQIPESTTALQHGQLVFIDNQVDQSTGMIRLKASFDNVDRHLWVGQFVNVTMTIMTLSDVVVIPTSAIQNSQSGPFVFVVMKDQSVEMRQIETGQALGERTTIQKGVQPDEVVVTDGQMRLTPGATVKPNNSLDDAAHPLQPTSDTQP
ncbi:MAG: Multidrug resistance protein MdtA [Phycisphaerae bacterium]|nr:Multidrug resistance protein MdtA [Phycisphaerae bacterium]